MNSGKFVKEQADLMILQGASKEEVIWNSSLNCVGFPYVFAATGQDCTPANRRAKYREDHPTIKTSCKNYSGDSTCDGCKWYPSCERVWMFDCQGFVKKTAGLVGITFSGGGCTSMWKADSNWEKKGTIDTLPEDELVCVFVDEPKTGKKSHIGWAWHGETIECSVGVQHFTKRKAKWTHWARPKNMGGYAPLPETRPTLRKGSTGEYVLDIQSELIQLGYDLGSYGADGKFGNATEKAVKAFQSASGLKADGVVGKNTWAALDAVFEQEEVYYTVTIPHLTKVQAELLLSQYPGSEKAEERG